LDVIARGKRKIIVGRRVYNGVDLRGIRFQNWRRASHFQRFSHLPNLERQVDAGSLVDGQDKCLARDGGKSTFPDLESVTSCRQL